jgi:hypothetical protein
VLGRVDRRLDGPQPVGDLRGRRALERAAVLDVLDDDGARGLRAGERERPGREAACDLLATDQPSRREGEAGHGDGDDGRRERERAPAAPPRRGAACEVGLGGPFEVVAESREPR